MIDSVDEIDRGTLTEGFQKAGEPSKQGIWILAR